MKNLNEIKRRIGSVAQTRKITHAMYLLSTSRMRRAIRQMGYNREYYNRVRATVRDALERTGDVTHPYLEHRGGGTDGIYRGGRG